MPTSFLAKLDVQILSLKRWQSHQNIYKIMRQYFHFTRKSNKYRPSSLRSPVSVAFRDSETLKQCENSLALAVTIMNLVASAKSLRSDSCLLSTPRCKSALNRHLWTWPGKFKDSTSNSLKKCQSTIKIKSFFQDFHNHTVKCDMRIIASN